MPTVPLSSMLMAQSPNRVQPNALGTGQLQKAGTAINTRQAYLQYVDQQQTTGQEALPYEEWLKMMQAQQGS